MYLKRSALLMTKISDEKSNIESSYEMNVFILNAECQLIIDSLALDWLILEKKIFFSSLI